VPDVRSTPPLPVPTTDEVRELLDASGVSRTEAAKLLGMTPRHLQDVTSGGAKLKAATWYLLRILLTQEARDSLPPPMIYGMARKAGVAPTDQ